MRIVLVPALPELFRMLLIVVQWFLVVLIVPEGLLSLVSVDEGIVFSVNEVYS